MHLYGRPLEKQRQLKSQPSLKIFNKNNSNNNNKCGVLINGSGYIFSIITVTDGLAINSWG